MAVRPITPVLPLEILTRFEFSTFLFFLLKKLETLCMKGLIQTHMGKRDEGMELVKKGIRLDLTSHICWHVFGLIQKGEKNYEEALKSYMQALKFDRVRRRTELKNIPPKMLICNPSGKYQHPARCCAPPNSTSSL